MEPRRIWNCSFAELRHLKEKISGGEIDMVCLLNRDFHFELLSEYTPIRRSFLQGDCGILAKECRAFGKTRALEGVLVIEK
jgi:hypothetical protein